MSTMTKNPIATRYTADGCAVLIFADGGISSRMGTAFPGIPLRPRRPEAPAIAWAFAGEVCAFDREELGELYAAARLGGAPGDVRRRAAVAIARKTFTWTVSERDRDGVVVESWGRSPKFPRAALLLSARRGARYQLFRFFNGSTETVSPTGFEADNLEDAIAMMLRVEAVTE